MKRNDGGKNVYKTACACNANASFDRSLSKTHYLIQYISAQRLLRKTWSAGGSSSCQISSFTRPDAATERTMRVLIYNRNIAREGRRRPKPSPDGRMVSSPS